MRATVAAIYLISLFSAAAVRSADDVRRNPGDHQFGQPEAVELIREVAKKWRASGGSPFSVGDLALRDNAIFPGHLPAGDHRTGLGIDVRPIRKDGDGSAVRWQDPEYDREATQRLVNLFNESGNVERIVFSDPHLTGTTVYRGLDGHMHITVKPRKN